MRIRKTLMVLAAVALPLSSVALLEGTAVAKAAVGTGTVTCNVGGTANFSPPLSATGSAGSKEVITITGGTLSGCTGGTPSPSAGGALAIKPIKLKSNTKGGANGKTKISGNCAGGNLGSQSALVVAKGSVAWSGAKKSKFVITGLNESVNGEGEVGFTSSDISDSGSYSGGTLTDAIYFQGPASSQLLSICGAGGPGSITSAPFDSSESSLQF